uniref:tetratricopeptide repeat protein n=1 Tax=Segatella copri TaxID=165179 RepID=UPI003FED4631
MRRSISFTILFFVMLSVLVSCYQSHKRELDLAYTLAESKPDSALSFLNHINQAKLSDEDMAKYALIYYMAQDKSGLDVDNDSLIRIAYDWYGEHQDDSLYASSLYYMGKCFLLNDSMEQAKACLDHSYSISDSLHNMNLKCLALDKLIEVEEQLAPYKALNYAKALVKMYESMPNVSIYNKVAAHLRLGENFFFVGSLKQALNEEKKAYSLAMSVDDNNLLSYVRQNLASTFEEMGEKDSCLLYARQAYDLNGNDRFSCQLMLASVYISVDSINQAFRLLKQAMPKTAEDRYSVFYFQSQAAMKAQDFKSAKSFSDSAYHYLEDMYRTASKAKISYYSSFLKKESERAKMQGKAEVQRWVFGLIVFLGLIIILFVLYAYWSYRKLSLARIAHEQEIFSQKQQMMEKLHQEELSHRDVQLSVIRNYLQKKIEVVEKLDSIVPNEGKHIVLSDNDWTELEVFLDSVEDLFVSRLKKEHPNLSNADVRLMMLLRLKLSQKTLASIYCVSEKAIKQKLFLYKDKVGIKNEHFSLRNYIENF